MASQSETFFVEYADALDKGDIQQLTDLHFVPSVFVSDETKHICAIEQDVHKYNAELVSALRRVGVCRHEAQVNQAMRLSDSILFVTVKWRMMDENDQQVFSCYCSYTLQSHGDTLRVVVAVLDDENKQISQLLANKDA